MILTGFMGAGKSTTGRVLAGLLGWRFVDLDEAVEAEAGKSVSALFAEEGEEAFRRRESDALARVLEERRIVVASGGGVLLLQRNRKLLAGRRVFYLRASPEECLRRLRTSATPRPLLGGDDPEGRARRLFGERRALYEGLGRPIDTEGRHPDDVAREIAGEVTSP